MGGINNYFMSRTTRNGNMMRRIVRFFTAGRAEEGVKSGILWNVI